MLSLKDILFGIVLPGLIALIVLAIAWRRWRKEATPYGWWAGPTALAAAFCIGFVQVNNGLPHWPPAEAVHRVFFVAPLLAIALLLVGVRRVPGFVRAVAYAIVAALAFGWVLQFRWRTMAATEATLWITLCAIITLLWTLAFTKHAKNSPRIASPIAMVIFGSATSALFILSDTNSYGLMEAALVAGLGASIIVALLSPDFSLARGGFFLFSLLTALLVALSVNSHASIGAGLEPINAALLVASPIVLWIASQLPLRKLRPPMRAVVVIVLMCVALGIALTRSAIKFQQTFKAKDASDLYEM